MNTGTIHCRDAVYWLRATLKFSMRFSNELALKAVITELLDSIFSSCCMFTVGPLLHQPVPVVIGVKTESHRGQDATLSLGNIERPADRGCHSLLIES